jgi:hypothetical protein
MRLGLPLIVGCATIASMVLVQATVITAIVRLVRRQVPPAGAFAHWIHNVGVVTRALLLIVVAQLVQIAVWAALFHPAAASIDDFATSLLTIRPSTSRRSG